MYLHLLLLSSLLFTIPDASTAAPYFAVCAIAKNEQAYVREWVAHHKCLGASVIYLHDHGSTPPLSEGLREFIDRGFVRYNHINDTEWRTPVHKRRMRIKPGMESKVKHYTNPQEYAYDLCMDAAERDGVTWMAFIDIDEFIVLGDKNVPGIKAFMRRYERAGSGLIMSRLFFGSNGHATAPNALVTASYTKCIATESAEETRMNSLRDWLKVIIRVRHTRFSIVHGASYKPGVQFQPFDENKKSYPSNTLRGQYIPREKIMLYHYWSKSVEEFVVKESRGGAVKGPNRYGREMLAHMDSLATDECLQMGPYLRKCWDVGDDTLRELGFPSP